MSVWDDQQLLQLPITSIVHSRFPITRFPVTKPLFNEHVTPPYNEQTIDPSSPTTTEWSVLEFEKVINEFDGFYHKLMN